MATSECQMRYPVDYSYFGIKALKGEGLPLRCRFSKFRKEPPRCPKGRYLAGTVWLSNNALTSLEGLVQFLQKRILAPLKIRWLDLSFNKIATIDPEIVSQLSLLEVVYLQCNCLESLEEIKKLHKLKFLKTLTLYGNPIETQMDYRLKVIGNLPEIKMLDFSTITPTEKYLAKVYEPKKKREAEGPAPPSEEEKAAEEEELVGTEESEPLRYVSSEEGEEEEAAGEEESISWEEAVEADQGERESGTGQIPGDVSWWTEREREHVQTIHQQLKEVEKKYRFEYFEG